MINSLLASFSLVSGKRCNAESRNCKRKKKRSVLMRGYVADHEDFFDSSVSDCAVHSGKNSILFWLPLSFQ